MATPPVSFDVSWSGLKDVIRQGVADVVGAERAAALVSAGSMQGFLDQVAVVAAAVAQQDVNGQGDASLAYAELAAAAKGQAYNVLRIEAEAQQAAIAAAIQSVVRVVAFMLKTAVVGAVAAAA